MSLRPALALALAGGLLLAHHADAGPAVGAEQAADTGFRLRTAAGVSYDVLVLASSPTQASSVTAPLMRLVVQPVGGSQTRYSTTLPASAVSVASDLATLRTTLAGVPLEVTWRSSPGVAVVALGDGAAAAGGVGGWSGAGQGAVADVRLGGIRCGVTGWLGVVVGHDTTDYGAPVGGALKGVSLKGASCTEIPYTSLPPVP